jgi:hypothetical protein
VHPENRLNGPKRRPQPNGEPDMFSYAVILRMNSRMLHDRAQFGSYVTFSVHDHETGGFLNCLLLGPNRINGPSCRFGSVGAVGVGLVGHAGWLAVTQAALAVTVAGRAEP